MAPRQRKRNATANNITISESLAVLSDFGRSLNLSVLVSDTSLKKAYTAAKTDGELPTNRARVLILGEPRAGKTSLLNRLLGRDFDRQEQPTHGIETRMCHVTDVDRHWNESGTAKADDIVECAAAVTVLGETSSDEVKDQDTYVNNNNRYTPHQNTPHQTPLESAASLLKIISQIILVTVVTSTLGLFQYGYVAFVWPSIFVGLWILDYNNAYRFMTSVSLVCVLFEAMIRINEPFENLTCVNDGNFSSKALMFTAENILFNLVNTILVGLASGLGCRTGIAVAFSACVHPTESPVTLASALQGVRASWNALMLSGIFGVGAILGIWAYTFSTANDRLHKTRAVLSYGLLVLLFYLFCTGDCNHRPYWFIFLNGLMMATGGTWGAMFGRRSVLKYGFNASYVTKKTAGFLFGLYLAYMCGWSLRVPEACLTSVVFYILSVTAHPLFDLHTSYRIWREKKTFPIKVIRDQMKSVIKGQSLLETKLSLWDFAGDALYHCAHHVFMPDRALYIVVFSMEAAVSDGDGELNKLLFWLNSVCAHAHHRDAVVIIVGTHKKSVSEESIMRFKDKLHHRITVPFCSRLVLNREDDRPLFLVENSQPLDDDFRQLRAEIFRQVESAQYAQEKYPIKYLHFYRQIQNRRKLAEVDNAANVVKLEEVRNLARSTCDIKGEVELKRMLKFFSEAGEIIYKDDDDTLQQHVVLDPQFLLDVMRKLVRIPRPANQSHRYAEEWRYYTSSGIISEELLRHIYRDMPHLVDLLTSLLKAYDLMCPVDAIINPNSPSSSFLVPSVLPPYHGEPEVFWESMGAEEVFYFDFGVFDPSTIYYRLLTRCLTSACLDKVNWNAQPLIFNDRCRFRIGASFIFKLQLEKSSAQQMLLSVTVLAFDPKKPSRRLLEVLVSYVRNIVSRDYPHLSFTFGPRCPLCSSPVESIDCDENVVAVGSEEKCDDKPIHILRLAGHDQPFPTASSIQMLCGQRRYELKMPGGEPQNSNTSGTPRRVAFTRNTSITKLPPDLFQRICLVLNNSRGPSNWKTLAGELGKDVESVALLDSDKVTNPTECLLKEWAMTDGRVTVADLLEVLARPSLKRADLVSEVRAQMTET